MKFTFEESELINNFFKDQENLSKSVVITNLESAKSNTEEIELIEIAANTIKKIERLDRQSFNNVFNDLPIDTYTNY